MNKAFILDYNLIKENGLTIEQFLALAQLECQNLDIEVSKEMLYNLQDLSFIKVITYEDKDIIVFREKSKKLLSKLTLKSNSKSIEFKPITVDLVNEIVKDLRLLWKGLKAGSMGSEEACRVKLKRWMDLNPSYNKEDILRAARIYLNSVDNVTYLQQADYFIYKKDGKDEMSRLSSFIDEKEEINTDWTTKLS